MGRVMMAVCGLTFGAMVGGGIAGQMMQASQPAAADFHGIQTLEEQGRALLIEAGKTPGGSATAQLEKYPGHFTSLTARTRSGGGELHRRWNDVFVAVDGEATVVTGGVMVNPHDAGPDEQRGSRVEGGDPHVLHKGDVIHISPNTPHQTLVEPGKTFVYFVVKVEEPAARVTPGAK